MNKLDPNSNRARGGREKTRIKQKWSKNETEGVREGRKHNLERNRV